MAHLSLPSDPGAPALELLDARRSGLDESGLRRRARELADGRSGGYTSRSYRFPYALVAWSPSQVGVDIERIEPWDQTAAESICTPDERFDPDAGEDAATFFSSLWSSKEALAKALGDAVSYDPRRLQSPRWWHAGRSGPWRAQRLDAPPGYVAWVCWREPDNA